MVRSKQVVAHVHRWQTDIVDRQAATDIDDVCDNVKPFKLMHN